MVSSKEKLKKIFDDLLNLDFYVSIVYPIEVEPLVSKTADYLHTTTGTCYLIDVNQKDRFVGIRLKRNDLT